MESLLTEDLSRGGSGWESWMSTGQKTTDGFNMTCIELYATGQNYHTKQLGFGYLWLSKTIPDTPTKTC